MYHLPLEILFMIFKNVSHKDLGKLACVCSELNTSVKQFREEPAYRALSTLSLFESENRKLVVLQNGRFMHKEIYARDRAAKKRFKHDCFFPENARREHLYGGAYMYLDPPITDHCLRCHYNRKEKPSNLFSLTKSLKFGISERRRTAQDILLFGEEDNKPLYLHYSMPALVYLHAIMIACQQALISISSLIFPYDFFDHYSLMVDESDASFLFVTKHGGGILDNIYLKTMMTKFRDLNPSFYDECRELGYQLLDELGYDVKPLKRNARPG